MLRGYGGSTYYPTGGPWGSDFRDARNWGSNIVPLGSGGHGVSPSAYGVKEAAVKQVGVDKAMAMAQGLANKTKKPVIVPIPNTGASKVVNPVRRAAAMGSKFAFFPKKRPIVLAPQARGIPIQTKIPVGHRGPVLDRKVVNNAAAIAQQARRGHGPSKASIIPDFIKNLFTSGTVMDNAYTKQIAAGNAWDAGGRSRYSSSYGGGAE